MLAAPNPALPWHRPHPWWCAACKRRYNARSRLGQSTGNTSPRRDLQICEVGLPETAFRLIAFIGIDMGKTALLMVGLDPWGTIVLRELVSC